MISNISYFVQRYFQYKHLKEGLQSRSKLFADLAREMEKAQTEVEDSEELLTALRKLLEAKDCYVRAFLKVEM